MQDINLNYQAQPTELSTPKSPITLIPPLPTSQSPTAPPPNPSIQISLDTTETSRPILQPVPPSKRAASPVLHPTNSIETNNDSNYLPQEFSEVLRLQQRRERIWRARMMICTSMISNIDSSIANFQEELEKDEAKAIQAYLREAIVKYAASEGIPPPPPVPTHSRPTKGKSFSKNIRPSKPVQVVAPSVTPVLDSKSKASKNLPTQPLNIFSSPNENKSSWATVVRNGNKKARADTSISAAISLATSPSKSVSQKAIPQTANKVRISTHQDQRLFVRLPQDHDWRKLSPAGIREIVVKRLMISPASIGLIKPVRSGFALSPCSSAARNTLLQEAGKLISTGARLEPATNWAPLLIPNIPNAINTLQGRQEITGELLIQEIERVTSVRPVAIKRYGTHKLGAPCTSWMAFFSEAPPSGFRVFDESGRATAFKKQQSLNFCKRCQGHHRSKFCSRAPSCGNCGSTMHSQEACQSHTKCKNCGGAHRSDSHNCPTRPTRAGSPTKEQMKVFRQIGEREYQAVVRAKKAEASAAAAEKANETIAEKTSENTAMEVEASLVEGSTGGAQRL